MVRVELKPRDSVYGAATDAYAPSPERPSPATLLATNRVAVLIAGGMVLIIIAWAVGWTAGKNRAQHELEPMLRRELPQVVEPGTDDPDVIGLSSREVVAKPPAGGRRSTILPPAAEGDPREAGLNYLYLADLPQADAQAAMDFLQSKGVDAHYVQVERSGSGANNAQEVICRLFTAPGLTKEELSQSARGRREAEILRLGAEWQKQHRGSSNFSKFQWRKSGV